MKFSFKPAYLPHIILGAGAVGFLLRIWLYATGVDHKGLLIADHPANLLVWILSAAAALILWLGSRDLVAAPKYSFNFPASVPGSMGTILAAAGIGICSFAELTAGPDSLGMTVAILGFVCVPVLCFTGWCRWQGTHPSMIFHGFVSIYLLLRLIWMYRQWSADPQLQDYAFQLLALVCLMLACYHRTAFDANQGRRRGYVVFHLAAVYFCCVSLPGCESMAFFLGCGAWMITNLCSLIPIKQPPREEE